MTAKPSSTTGRKITNTMKKDFAAIEPLLDCTGEWQLADATVDMSNTYRSLCANLARIGALDVVDGYDESDSDGQTYRWVPAVKTEIQQYAEHVDRLPCGCRAHIPPGDKAPGDWYACKHCGAGHTRQTIQAAMDR